MNKCPCENCISFPICNAKKVKTENNRGGTIMVISFLDRCSLLNRFLNTCTWEYGFTKRVNDLKRIYGYE